MNEIQWATPEIWIYREDYQTQVCIDSPPNDAVKYVKASTALTLSSRVVDLEDIVKNLSMLVKRLSRFAPDDIAEKAKDYLSRQGFTGSPLRENDWARQIPDDVAKRAPVVFATDYDTLDRSMRESWKSEQRLAARTRELEDELERFKVLYQDEVSARVEAENDRDTLRTGYVSELRKAKATLAVIDALQAEKDGRRASAGAAEGKET